VCIVLALAASACLPRALTPISLVPASAEATAATGVSAFQPDAPPSTEAAESASQDPAGCRQPPDDYTRVKVNGKWINRRTQSMLEYAQSFYGGPIDVRGPALTQGSYSNNGPASFGTHLGGGAVDISVIRPNGSDVLYTEVERLVRALRVAGFAAWLRDWGELSEGSGIHIHAIAIGDRELSDAAREQLTGAYGYFRGYSGLPTANKVPALDHHGGPIICDWMIAAGYSDLRSSGETWPVDWPRPGWRDRLPNVAAEYIAEDNAQAVAQARRIDFLSGPNEDPSNMCGPLAGAILMDAGLLPSHIGPLTVLKNYWLANPSTNRRPWSLFPAQQYEVFSFHESIRTFDFGAWPLAPGDFVYTHAGRGEYDHMFIVTDVDAMGRAFTVTNQQQPDLSYRVEHLMLYDPQDSSLGVMRDLWVRSARLGRTGLAGFEVLRRVGVSQVSGSAYRYRVEPGDTPQLIARKFETTLDALTRANPSWTPPLQVGQSLTVLVGLAR
jgi:LysM domain